MNFTGCRLRKRNVFVLSLFLCVALLGAWTPAQAQSGGFAYVANTSSRNISAYSTNAETGALTPVPGSPFPANGQPQSLVVDPTGRFLYATNVGHREDRISAYTIDPESGALTPVLGSPFDTGPLSYPARLGMDPTGQFLYVPLSGFSWNSVRAFRIDTETGALAPVPGSPFPTGLGPSQAVVDPTGQFVYVANQGVGSVSGYTIDPETGGLTQMAGSPFPLPGDSGGPTGMTVDPTGRFAYAVSSITGNVSGYSIDADSGALIPIPGSPFPAGRFAFSVAVDPTGQFAYVANAGFPQGGVTALNIDADTGTLTLIDSRPAGAAPLWVAVDPTGQFVYVANSNSDSVSGYTIDPETGGLTPMAGSPFPTPPGSRPNGITTTAGPLLQGKPRRN